MDRPKSSVSSFAMLATTAALLVIGVDAAQAQDTQGTYESVILTFRQYSAFWQGTLTLAATWLFWSLAVMQFVLGNLTLALKGGDISDFIETNTKQILFIGVMYVFLVHAFDWSTALVHGFLQVGQQAASAGALQPFELDPASIFQQGLVVAMEVADELSVWSPGKSVLIAMCVLVLLILFGLVAAFTTLVLVEAYILIGASVLFLGFGGSSWTSDIAKRVLMYAVSVGAKLFVIMLVVGLMIRVTQLWIDSFDSTSLNDVLALVGFVGLFACLAKTIPELVQGLLSGTSVGGTGGLVATAAAGAGATFAAGQALKSLASAAGGAAEELKKLGTKGSDSVSRTASESAGGWKDVGRELQSGSAHGMTSIGSAIEAATGANPIASGPLAAMAQQPMPGKPDAPKESTAHQGGGDGKAIPAGGTISAFDSGTAQAGRDSQDGRSGADGTKGQAGPRGAAGQGQTAPGGQGSGREAEGRSAPAADGAVAGVVPGTAPPAMGGQGGSPASVEERADLNQPGGGGATLPNAPAGGLPAAAHAAGGDETSFVRPGEMPSESSLRTLEDAATEAREGEQGHDSGSGVDAALVGGGDRAADAAQTAADRANAAVDRLEAVQHSNDAASGAGSADNPPAADTSAAEAAARRVVEQWKRTKPTD